MNEVEIFYLVLAIICFGGATIYALIYAFVVYRKGKAEMRQRRKDEIRKKEELRKIAPEIYEKIYGKKEEKIG